jgi:hypothetical protein
MNQIQGLISKEMFGIIHNTMNITMNAQIKANLRTLVRKTLDEVLDNETYREQLTEYFYQLAQESFHLNLDKESLYSSIIMPQTFNDITPMLESKAFNAFVNEYVKPVLMHSPEKFILMLRKNFSEESSRWNDSTLLSFHSKLRSAVFRKAQLRERFRQGTQFVTFFFEHVYHMNQLI